MVQLFHPQLSLNQYFNNSLLDWGALAPAERRMLSEHTETVDVKSRHVLFHEGTYPKGVYRIISGKVKLYKPLSDGSSQLVGLCISDEVFAYRAVISNQVHSVSAATLEPSVLEFIPSEVFMNVLHNSVEFSNFLLVKMSQEFGMWINRALLFAQMDIRRRLAITLLVLNEKFKTPKSITPTSAIHISRTDLAAFVGATLETVIRMLKKFVDEDLIKVKGKNIIISDLKQMLKVADIG